MVDEADKARYYPFEKLPEAEPKRPEQLKQLVYSHLLAARADFNEAADREEASNLIRQRNSELRRRRAAEGRDTYERVCQELLRDVFGKGYI